MVRRNYIFDTIRKVFQLYGYLPIETPAMENLSTLMGKYGEEGDKLIFKILNSGDYTEKLEVRSQKLEDIDSKKLTNLISEKALKYDLTVPFARYVVQHQHEITFPFKRYQIQPVWRADRPQKGRYREFYQCDADVIGSNSLINEVELVQMIDDVFTKLNIKVKIHFNNRKVLAGIAEVIDESDKIVDITVAIDKLDKIGIDGVNKELAEKGVSSEAIKKLQPLLIPEARTRENITSFLTSSEIAEKGLKEVTELGTKCKNLGIGEEKLHFDITLARGLNYYTGTIFEVKVNDERSSFTSSICGGGRYDDLTGIFGLPNMSGVGISFGADRIYDVLEELNLYPPSVASSSKLLFVTFGEKEQVMSLPWLTKIRKAGINSEIYPDASAKMKKQMGYADDKKIPYVVIVGSEEIESGLLSLKDMNSGEQVKLSIDDIINKLK